MKSSGFKLPPILVAALILAVLVMAIGNPGSTNPTTSLPSPASIASAVLPTIQTPSATQASSAANTPVPITARTPSSPEPDKGNWCDKGISGDLVPPTATPRVATRIPTKQATKTPKPNVQYDLTGLSTRAGFGMEPYGSSPEPWAAILKAGWYVNWAVDKRLPSQLPELWQTVRVHDNCFFPSLEYIQWLATNYPGSVWIIGNEPDVVWQDNVAPEEYAHLYHDAYTAIKQADPTARVAVGAVAQGTPLRLEYLDRVLAEYQKQYGQKMPADWWTVHGYVLREEHNSWGVEIPPGFNVEQGMLWEISDHSRLDLFKQGLIAFRQWMSNNGYRSVPLALTEFGILMPPDLGFPIEQVAQYMQDTFHWLQTASDPAIGNPGDNNLLVQRWAWFALDCIPYPSPNLEDTKTGELTLLGVTFRDYLQTYHP